MKCILKKILYVNETSQDLKLEHFELWSLMTACYSLLAPKRLDHIQVCSIKIILTTQTYIKFVMPNPAFDQSREEADSKKHKTEPRVLHFC